MIEEFLAHDHIQTTFSLNFHLNSSAWLGWLAGWAGLGWLVSKGRTERERKEEEREDDDY